VRVLHQVRDLRDHEDENQIEEEFDRGDAGGFSCAGAVIVECRPRVSAQVRIDQVGITVRLFRRKSEGPYDIAKPLGSDNDFIQQL